MPKAKPQDVYIEQVTRKKKKTGEVSTAWALKIGDEILIEAQKRETVEAAADSLREKFAAIVGMS